MPNRKLRVEPKNFLIMQILAAQAAMPSLLKENMALENFFEI